MAHYPQPKLNQKSPKDLILILILTMEQVYTYFWKTLPICDWISLAPIIIVITFTEKIENKQG